MIGSDAWYLFWGVLNCLAWICYLKRKYRWQKRLKKAEVEAHRDPLTGLENRRALLEAFSENSEAIAALGIVDLDEFKPVNDRYGHHTGDQVLQTIALRLQAAALNQNAHVYRLGGDEFAVVWCRAKTDEPPSPSTALSKTAAARMGRQLLREAIDPILEVEGHRLSVGASLGVAVNNGLVSTDDLMRTADAALYACKPRAPQDHHPLTRDMPPLALPLPVVPSGDLIHDAGAAAHMPRTEGLGRLRGRRGQGGHPRVHVRARMGVRDRRHGRGNRALLSPSRMRKTSMDDGVDRLALAAAGLVLAALVGLALLVQGVAAVAEDPKSLLWQTLFGAGDCAPDPDRVEQYEQQVAAFDAEQQSNARMIIQSGHELGVPWQGWVIAVATAIQKSNLRNVAHGDSAGPDSRGLFQQRASWGSLEARMTPATAARMFYLGGQGGQPGLQDIPYLREGMSVAEAAQAVQRSRYPDAYGEHEEAATALVLSLSVEGSEIKAMDACESGPDSEVVDRAIAYARSQLGQPYLWGGDGPAAGENGFDCSGLTRAAYEAAGVSLPRTARQQYDHGPRISLEHLRPGDLVFYGSGPGNVTHVGLYVGDDRMIDAPHSGAVVRVEDYRWASLLGATRPTTSQ